MELVELAAEASTLRTRNAPFLLATVVRTRGSSYRRPGARMLVALGDRAEPPRWLAGSVSGGCLEVDVMLRGAWATACGATVITYDSSTDEGDLGWGVGLGCNGIVDVLLQRIAPDAVVDPLRLIADVLAAGRPGALATVFESRDPRVCVGAQLAIAPDGGVTTDVGDPRIVATLRAAAERAGHMPSAMEVDGVTALIERIEPPPHVFVIGTNHDAVPLVELVRAMGWRVTVCDTIGKNAHRFVDPLIAPPHAIRGLIDATYDPYVVVMTHSYDRDRELVRALLGVASRYLGIMGPAHRTAKLFAELGEDRARHHHVFAPVGLQLGARSPREIALAIVAEIQAIHHAVEVRVS